jgi:hypothetical protein
MYVYTIARAASKTIADVRPGPSRMEHPRARRHGLVRCRLGARMHQHRIHDSSAIHLVSWCSRHPQLLPGRDWHVDLATTVWRSITASQMVSGQIWACDQYCGCMFHPAALVLCVLAYCYARDGGDDELGQRDIFWSVANCCGVLCC